MTGTLTEYDLSSSFSNGATIDWSNKALWSTGSIPNDFSALVVFQSMTDASGNAKNYNIEISSCESYSICTLDMASSELTVAGKLTLQTGVNIISNTAELIMAGGTVAAGDLHLAGTTSVKGIVGTGTVSASDYLYNQSSIISSTTATANSGGSSCWNVCAPACGSNATLTLTGDQLVNSGLLQANSGTTLVVNFTDFTNFAGGTLTGGSYEANGGTIDLHTTGLITTDDAAIVLDGITGGVDSFNTATGKYVALQSSLTTIAAGGSLELDGTPYVTSLAVTDKGDLSIDGCLGGFAGPSLTVAAGGTVELHGQTPLLNDVITVKSLINNGTITVEADSSGTQIIAASSITGSGAIVLGAASGSAKASVELTGSVANTIQFADGTGTLILDTPKSMTGAIADFTAGDHITLAGSGSSGLLGSILSLFGIGGSSSSVTYSYAGNTSAGVLTLHQGSSTYNLAFDGDYTKSSFSVTSDSHGIEIVGVAHAV